MSVGVVIILAIIQGLTEFLPISSKTHLLLAQHLFGLKDPERNLFVIVFLHAGSLLAVFVYYGRAWLALFTKNRFEIVYIAIGSVPVVLVGLFFRKKIEALFASPALGCGLLLVTAAWLFLAERFGRERHPYENVPWWKVLLIGLAQACALLPGLSRSGATIGAGYLGGLPRKDAVRFSFFLGAPAILGVILLKGKEAVERQVRLDALPILIGVGVTFFVSLAAIRILEILSLKGRLSVFAVYCAAVGAAGLIYFLVKG